MFIPQWWWHLLAATSHLMTNIYATFIQNDSYIISAAALHAMAATFTPQWWKDLRAATLHVFTNTYVYNFHTQWQATYTALHTMATIFTYFILSHCWCNLQLTFGMNKNFESAAHILKWKTYQYHFYHVKWFLIASYMYTMIYIF